MKLHSSVVRRATPVSSKLEQAMTLLARKIKKIFLLSVELWSSLLQGGVEAKSANGLKKRG